MNFFDNFLPVNRNDFYFEIYTVSKLGFGESDMNLSNILIKNLNSNS